MQQSAGRAPQRPPYPLVTLQRRRWRHTNELTGLYVLNSQHEKGNSLAAGILIVFLRNNVFHHYSTSTWLSYIPACSHIGALWEFSSAAMATVGIPPPHTPHYPLKPLLLLSPQGPDLAPLALRPFRDVRPRGLNAATTRSFHRDDFACAYLRVHFNAL